MSVQDPVEVQNDGAARGRSPGVGSSRSIIYAGWSGCFFASSDVSLLEPELPLPEPMSPEEITIKTEQIKDLRGRIAVAMAFGGTAASLIMEERALLAELKAGAHNPIGISADELPLSARIVWQNLRLIQNGYCDHASEIVKDSKLFVGGRPFAITDNNGVYFAPSSQNAEQVGEGNFGVLLLQDFVAKDESPVCVISLCTDWELSDEQGSPGEWQGCYAVTGSTIFPSGSKVERVSVGVGLGDHGSYDPRTNALIDFEEILRVVNLAKQRLQAGYRVLIHCFSGMERSVMLCIVLLMLKDQMSLTAAHALVQEYRPIAKDVGKFTESIKAVLGRALVYVLANNSEAWNNMVQRCRNGGMTEVCIEFGLLAELIPHVAKMSLLETEALEKDVVAIQTKMHASLSLRDDSFDVFKQLSNAATMRKQVLREESERMVDNSSPAPLVGS